MAAAGAVLLLVYPAQATRGRPASQNPNNYNNHRQLLKVPSVILKEYHSKSSSRNVAHHDVPPPSERATIGDMAAMLERHGVVDRETGKTPLEWATLLLTRPIDAEKVFKEYEHLFTTSGQKLMRKTINALIDSLSPVEKLRRDQESLFFDIKKVQSAIRSWGLSKRSDLALEKDFARIAGVFPLLGETPTALFINEGRDFFGQLAQQRDITPLENSVIDLFATEFEKTAIGHVQKALKKPSVQSADKKVAGALKHLFGIYLKQVSDFKGSSRAGRIDSVVDAFLRDPNATIHSLEDAGALSPAHKDALAHLATDIRSWKN